MLASKPSKALVDTIASSQTKQIKAPSTLCGPNPLMYTWLRSLGNKSKVMKWIIFLDLSGEGWGWGRHSRDVWVEVC